MQEAGQFFKIKNWHRRTAPPPQPPPSGGAAGRAWRCIPARKIPPRGAEFHPAMLFSLGTLVMASTYFIMTRLLAGIETNATQQVWSSGIATVALLPFALHVWVWPEAVFGWVILCAIGAFGALGHIAATTAHRWADASIIAPIIYTQVFWAALVGVVIFDTYPTTWTILGAAVIIAPGFYILHRERQKGKALVLPE